MLEVIRKQKMQKPSSKLVQFRQAIFLALLVFVFAGGLVVSPLVHADQFDEQIKQLSQDSSAKRAAEAQLGAEANSLSDKVAKLQAQIAVIQGQINANQDKRDDLQRQITAAEAELDKQKKVLGENIKVMYLEGQTTTLEVLASSKDLSDFVDQEEYRNTVRDKVTDTLAKINDLKHQLKGQKEEVEQLLKDQQTQQAQLDAQRAEQAGLLSLNQQQQADYNNQIKDNSKKIADLRAQQIAANSRFIGSAGNGPACGGGYPARWCEIPQDSTIDNWGMYNRECVSYTAFRVAASGRNMPYWGGFGNANQWDDNARASGIPVDGSPRAGDVAISNSGAYGHAMYVESVNGNGTINISQYNAALNGTFSTNTISVGSLVFIHFP